MSPLWDWPILMLHGMIFSNFVIFNTSTTLHALLTYHKRAISDNGIYLPITKNSASRILATRLKFFSIFFTMVIVDKMLRSIDKFCKTRLEVSWRHHGNGHFPCNSYFQKYSQVFLDRINRLFSKMLSPEVPMDTSSSGGEKWNNKFTFTVRKNWRC